MHAASLTFRILVVLVLGTATSLSLLITSRHPHKLAPWASVSSLLDISLTQCSCRGSRLAASSTTTDDDKIKSIIPDVLRMLQTQRPYASEELLYQMCLKYPILQEGKVFLYKTKTKKTRDDDNDNDTYLNDDEVYHSLDEDNDYDENTEQQQSLPSTRPKMKCFAAPLKQEMVVDAITDLMDMGYTDDDICHMLSIKPDLIVTKHAQRNVDYLMNELGISKDWLLRTARGFPNIFKSDLSGKVRVWKQQMELDDEFIVGLVRRSNLRIFSYDIGRKLDVLRELDFTEEDIRRVLKKGGNVLGMDLRRRFQRLEDAGFRDAIQLVKRYPQLLALRTKTIEQFVEAGLGLSYDDVVRMAEKCPAILGLDASKAIECLEELLFPTSASTTTSSEQRQLQLFEVGTLLRAFPQALTYNVDNRVHLLAGLLSEQEEPPPTQLNKARVLLGKMVKSYPPILGYNLESRVALLQEAGLARSQCLRALPNFPQLVSYDVKARMQKLHEAGLCPPLCPSLGQLIGSFPPLIGYDIEKKIRGLETWVGVNRTQALTMIARYPRIVQVNAETTAGPAAQCLLQQNITTLEYLVQHPRVLTRSVSKCLEPRLQRLKEIGQPPLAPTTLVSFSNAAFEEYYGKLGDPPPPSEQRRRQSRKTKQKQ